MEVAFHAELSNHIHVIVRTRPDVAAGWSDEDVVRRWLSIIKLKRNGADSIVEPSQEEMNSELRQPGRVAELRGRLANVSWFMGTLCEAISRRCNRDAGTSGAFWEHRFDCRSLADEAAILVCGIYVEFVPRKRTHRKSRVIPRPTITFKDCNNGSARTLRRLSK